MEGLRRSRGARGGFFCHALPALDKEAGEFTEEAGSTRWYYFVLGDDTILHDPGEIVASVRSTPRMPRRCAMKERTLLDVRRRVEPWGVFFDEDDADAWRERWRAAFDAIRF